MGLRHRKNKNADDDVESNDTAVNASQEKGAAFSASFPQGGASSDDLRTVEPEFQGDEYEKLLAFVDYEAERNKHGGDDDDDEEQVEEKRVWYAPWKTRKVKSEKAKKVPDDWLRTDIGHGLDDSEVEKRRGDFGYNGTRLSLHFPSSCLPTHDRPVPPPRSRRRRALVPV